MNANDAKTQGLPEMIAERLGDEGYLAMMKEPVSALIREVLLGSELFKMAENAEKRLHESSGTEHIRLMENENCACNSCFKRRLRAALNALKEKKNE